MDKSLIVLILLIPNLALAQTHTMPGSNVVPSGASLTIQSGGSFTAAAGSTITGLGGGTGTVTSITATTPIIVTPSPLIATGVISLDATSKSNWDTAFSQVRQWDGGATGLVAATGRTSLALVPGTNVEVPLTFSTGLTRTTNTITVNTSQNIATLSNLTTNGFVKTGGAVGTLSVDTATYQAADADLTTWAGITPVAAVGTWIATPSSANLRGAVTDENGTGALLFSGATTPDFTTGFTIGAAAASGKIPIGNGTNYVPSTPTWPTASGAAGYTVRSSGTNFASYPAQLVNSSVSAQSPSTSDVYLAGSSIVVTAGDFKATGQYKCVFDMTKSAGTGAIVITLRVGTGSGAVGDAAIQTYTFGAGTSVADFGMFEVVATWRTVGSGTSAVIQGMCRGTHQLATTGLFNNAAGWMVLGSPSPSSGFNSNTATVIGLSFNGSTAFAGTTQVVQAQLQQ